MELIREFGRIGKNDAGIAGGKGASLGEMTQAGIPVPPGFVVLSTTFDRFIEETDLDIEIDAILATVKQEEMHTVEHASERIQKLILDARMPEDIASGIMSSFKALGAEFVAVRSSATAEDSASAAWAGQLDTYLNTTEANVIEKVQECWASLFTPRAVFYRFEKGLHTEKISVAVVVQKMVNSDAAGIAFSVHPVTEDRNQLIIEAGFGLGEAVVSGQITPDSYVVSKEPREIVDKNLADQEQGLYRKEGGGNEWRSTPQGKDQVLSDEQILALAETVIGIEKHYGFPVDTEWAMEAGEIYITQSRPITTLSEEVPAAPAAREEKASIILSKIFTRERPLFYFAMWRVCDAEALKEYVGEDLKYDLFMVPPAGQPDTVWYSMDEFNRLADLGEKRINSSKEFGVGLIEHVRSAWIPLKPYLEDGKRLENAAEFYQYYRDLISYWLPMNSPFFTLPDRPTIDPDFKQGIVAIREEKQEYTEKMNAVFLEYFERAFPDLAHLSHYVIPEEVVALEKERSPELIAMLEERAKQGCFLFEGKMHLLPSLDGVLKEHGAALETFALETGKSLQGTSAFKGTARGTVRLVMTKADMAKVMPGDILVAPMTDPNHVPAMKIAGAVVTDEGGMTCHAAIASRELKVPCVVGTKIATSVLKDGDTVEVDANTGTVRILA